ncbi:MAG: hypothetical protein ACI9H8_002032, partial [Lysobacterales bacterium]
SGHIAFQWRRVHWREYARYPDGSVKTEVEFMNGIRDGLS